MQPTHLARLAIVYLVVVLAVVVTARLGLYPGVGRSYPAESTLEHPYRLAMGLTAALLAAALGAWSAAVGRRLHSPTGGLAALLGGGIATGLLLTGAPWVLHPTSRYPVLFLWLLVGTPVGVSVWAALSFAIPARGTASGI